MKTWKFEHPIISKKSNQSLALKIHWKYFYNAKLVKFKWVTWAHDKSFFKVIKVMGKTHKGYIYNQ